MPAEQVNWGKEWIDFGFTFGATVLGVLLAFELDRWRDRRELRAKKLKLIQSLIVELDFIAAFCRENPSLLMYTDVHLQTDTLDETIKDQLDFFDHKTNNVLKHIRKYLVIEKANLLEWARLNKAATGTGKYPTQNDSYTAGNIKGGWNSFITAIPPMILEVKKEFERERNLD